MGRGAGQERRVIRSRHASPWRLAALGVALASCAGSEPGRGGSSPAALTAADPSSRAAVVAIADADGSILGATGVLVGPHAVLTAAHAVQGLDPIALRVVFTSTLGSPTDRRYGVARIFVDPEYAGGPEHDLAILRLTTAPTEATPLPTPTGTPGARGESVLLCGFGAAAVGASGDPARREGMTTLTVLDGATWRVSGPTLPCAGDVGAPMLVDEAGTLVVGALVSVGDCSTYGLGPMLSASAPFLDDTLALVEEMSDAGPRPDAGVRVDAGRVVRDAGVPPRPGDDVAPSGCTLGRGIGPSRVAAPGALALVLVLARARRRHRPSV